MRHYLTYFILLLALAASIWHNEVWAQCPSVELSNQIVNAGFEDVSPPCPSSWNSPPFVDAAFNQGCMAGWFAVWGTPSVCNNGPFEGDNYACLGANNEGIFTNLSLCEGVYELSFYTKRISGSGGFLDVYLANGLVNLNPGNGGFPPLTINPSWELLSAVPVNGAWNQTILSITIPPNALNTQLLMVLRGPVDIGIDNVFLQACEQDYLDDIQCENLGGGTFNLEALLNNAGLNADLQVFCWDMGDGTTFLDQGTSVVHTYDQEGTYTVCFSVVDECGCIDDICKEIVYQDCSCTCEENLEVPVILNPPQEEIILICAAEAPPPPEVIVSLNCGDPDIAFEESTSGGGCEVIVSRTWTITSPCGNETTLTQTVRLLDNVPPAFTFLPLDTEAACETAVSEFQQWLNNNGNGTAEDNCGAFTWTITYGEAPGTTCPIIPVTFLLTDACGNTNSHVATFTVNDDSPPLVLNPPPSPLTVNCPSDIPGIPVLQTSDNCTPTPLITFNEIILGEGCTQDIIRQWFVQDECSNVTQIEQYIYLRSLQVPIIDPLPATVTVACGADIAEAFTDWLESNGGAQASVPCGTLNWTFQYSEEPSGACSETLVTFQAEDACGNTATATAYFIVADTLAPAFTRLPESVQIACATNPGQQLLAWVASQGGATASDLCDSVRWSNNFSGDTTLSQYNILFEARDGCGNASTAGATFTILPQIDTTFSVLPTCDPLQVGFDTLVLVVNGCDSVVVTENRFQAADSTFQTLYVCSPAEVRQDTLRLSSSSGCDSLVFRHFIPGFSDTTFLFDRRCDIVAPQTDTLTLQGLHCDSIVVIQRIPLPSDTLRFSLVVCDPADAGQDTTFLFNQFGCDSLIVYTRTFSPPDTTRIQLNTCDSTLAGTETVRLPNRFGCDSLIITTRTLADFTFSEQVVRQCGVGTDFTDTLRFSGSECDSFVFVHYRFFPIDTTAIDRNTCDPAQAGFSQVTLTNQFDCDSILLIQTTLRASPPLLINDSSCRPELAGTFTDTLSNAFGCDSIVIRQVQFLPLDTTFLFNTSCDPQQAGTRLLQLSSTLGCDSIVRIQTELLPSDTIRQDTVICLLAQPFSDSIRLVNQFGCDSLIIRLTRPEPMPLRIDLGPDQIVREGESVSLLPNIIGEVTTFRWHPDSLFACPGCPSQTLFPERDVRVRLDVISPYGCIDSTSVFLRVIRDINIFIPDAFTPDLDGINDKFTVFGSSRLARILSLQVFDRWGNLLYNGQDLPPSDPRYGWDGSFKGQRMDPAVFAYLTRVLTSDGQMLTFSGEVQLLR
jgi:gliding motility-associated-like protein